MYPAIHTSIECRHRSLDFIPYLGQRARKLPTPSTDTYVRFFVIHPIVLVYVYTPLPSLRPPLLPLHLRTTTQPLKPPILLPIPPQLPHHHLKRLLPQHHSQRRLLHNRYLIHRLCTLNRIARFGAVEFPTVFLGVDVRVGWVPVGGEFHAATRDVGAETAGRDEREVDVPGGVDFVGEGFGEE